MENTGQYRGGTRLTGPVVGFATFDEEQLRRLKLVMSLYMSVTQLALCAAQCRATGHVPDAEEIYFLDSFVSRSAQRADAHTVTRLTTADAALADAFGALVEECRDEHRGKTPPMTLRAAADAVYARLRRQRGDLPYLQQAAVRFTLADATEAALLELQGKAPKGALCVRGDAVRLTEIAAGGVERVMHRVVNGDTLCLLCGQEQTPQEVDCRAVRAFLTDRTAQGGVKQLFAVEPAQLLPETLRRFYGLTLYPQQLWNGTLSSLLDETPGGWIVGVATAQTEALRRCAEAYGLRLIPYATVNRTNRWTIDPRLLHTFSYPGAFLAKLTLAQAYEIAPDPVAEAAYDVQPLRCDICQRGSADCLQMRYYAAHEAALCRCDAVRCSTIPLHEGLCRNTVDLVLADLLAALSEDGAQTAQATVGISLSLGASAAPSTVWLSLLTLYRALSNRALSLLSSPTIRTGCESTQMTVWVIAPRTAAPADDLTSAAAPRREGDCSLLHVASPLAVLPRLAGTGDMSDVAEILTEAGARVTVQPTDGTHEGCTALADAILGAQILVLAGESTAWLPVLSHRRVRYALDCFFEKDGLLLAAGGAMEAFCCAGLGGNAAAALNFDKGESPFICPVADVSRAPSPLLPDVATEKQTCAVLTGATASAEDETALAGMIAERSAKEPSRICSLLLRDSHALLCAAGLKKEQLLAAVRYFQ